MTQAAISQHIKTLETHLGLRFFIRRARRVSSIKKGKRLLPYIQAGFDNFIKGVALLIEETHPNVSNATALESWSTKWLVPRFPSFHEQHPEMTVRLEPCNRVTEFASSDIDLAIRLVKESIPDLKAAFL